MSKSNKSQNPKGIWARVRLGPAGHSCRLGTEVMGDTEYNRKTEKKAALQEINEQESSEEEQGVGTLNGIEGIIDAVDTNSVDCSQQQPQLPLQQSAYFAGSSERASYNTLAQKLQEYINK